VLVRSASMIGHRIPLLPPCAAILTPCAAIYPTRAVGLVAESLARATAR
jgi:hypothetical protein